MIEFIKDVWQFHGDPVMVVLDFKGKVTSLNAIDMISIWHDLAYPFSVAREKELWVEQSWTMELLIDNIDPLIMYWVRFLFILFIYLIFFYYADIWLSYTSYKDSRK